MVNVLKQIIQFLLKWLAKIYLWRIDPYVIVIAGTTGRHWIKEAVVSALNEKDFSVQVSRKNFNAEIGMPLSIFGLPSGERSVKKWLKVLSQAIKKVIMPGHILLAPNYFVLEMAIDRPEDMDYLLSIVKPDAAVLTNITMIYAENFEDLDEIALEYKKLAKSLPVDGLLILNADDDRVYNLKDCASCWVVSYGIKNEEADYLARNIRKLSDGQEFELFHRETIVGSRLELGKKEIRAGSYAFKLVKINRFGQHHIYAELVKEIVKNNYKVKLD